MLAKEYIPSKTIMLEPLRMPQILENTANPAEAQTEKQQQPTFPRGFAGRHGAGYSYACLRPEPVDGRIGGRRLAIRGASSGSAHDRRLSLPREVCGPSCGSTSQDDSSLDRHLQLECRRRREHPA